jgi:5-formyltetrahydrofolate cyclo-ligase
MSDQPTPEFDRPLLDNPFLDKKSLRRRLREQRRALSLRAQRAAAERVALAVVVRPEFLSADHIAVYLAADGELDPTPLITQAWAAGKRLYLPVLQPGNCLKFAEYRPNERLHSNPLGLLEPVIKNYRDANQLDLVLMPLVGFDRQGGRLGMGGGFYDRSFEFLIKEGGRESGKCRPRLVGLAHACQQVDNLPGEAWDVPMTAVATDRGWITMRP